MKELKNGAPLTPATQRFEGDLKKTKAMKFYEN